MRKRSITISLGGINGANKFAIIDEEDYKIVGNYKWYLSDQGYALSTIKGKNIRMHKLIMNTPSDMVTDHKNHNRLDNRRINLRIVTQKENARNRGNSMGYCYDKSRGKWLVTYKGKYFGRYNTEEEAKKASLMSRSGIRRPSKAHPRRKYLPDGVYYMSNNSSNNKPPYYIRPTINGKRKFYGYFSSIQDAKMSLNEILEKEK